LNINVNHEDSLVISETASNLCRGTKSETIILPIYTHSLFKGIYPNSRYKVFPETGQTISEEVVAYKSVPKNNTNIIYLLKSMNLTDFSSVVGNELQFNSIPITSRLKNGTVVEIRVHRINKYSTLIDTSLDSILNEMSTEYFSRVAHVFENLKKNHTEAYSRHVLAKHYVLTNRLGQLKYSIKDLVYIIEIKIAKESRTTYGDKIANRYAHKGVVSLILPNEFRPYAMKSKHHIDVMVGPISIISRMNMGQVFEGDIAKVVVNAEEQIKRDPTCIPEVLAKLSIIANSLGDHSYAKSILELSQHIKTSPKLFSEFKQSVEDLGLYFEVPNFATFNDVELHKNIDSLFGVSVTEPLLIKRDLLAWMNELLQTDFEIPKKDVILEDVYAAPIYTIKLKQESAGRLTARDFGSYKATNKQPVNHLAASYSNVC